MRTSTTLMCLAAMLCHHLLLAQTSKNITKIGQLQYNSASLHGDVSDIWGYVDSLQNEYAIVGLEHGVSIVNVTNGSNPVEVFYVGGGASIWRDIKTWNKHAYITNEKSGGLMIIDLSKLPATIQSTDVYSYFGSTYPFTKAHNIFIDENGVGYIFGANVNSGGAIFLDLDTDPKNPIELGAFSTHYLHDGMARGDTLWGAAINAGVFAVIDVSDKANPVILKTHATSFNFTHNCWISDDGNTLFTTDEKSGALIGAYDVSNLSNIQNTDLIQSSPGALVIPHNTHVFGDFLVTSYYRDGVTIVDASHPDKLVEVGYYDSSPLTGSGFNGCWGAYPWLPSGKLLISDIESGLFVLQPNYVHGVYIEGVVRKFSDSATISTPGVQGLNPPDVFSANLLGFYERAYADSGTYQFVFSKPGFLSDTLNVSLKNGVLRSADIYLRNETPFGVVGRVIDPVNQVPVANAKVRLSGGFKNYEATTNVAGYFEIDSVYEDNYLVSAGKWEYETKCYSRAILSGDTIDAFIAPLISDNFTFDYGWTAINGGVNGFWEIEDFSRSPFVSTLDFPVMDDHGICSNRAAVTERRKGVDHDVDGGVNSLVSPVFNASGYEKPVVGFSYWFRNDAAFGQADSLNFYLIAKGDTIPVLKVNNTTTTVQSQWVEEIVYLHDFLSDYSAVQFMVSAGDYGIDSQLEAGLDAFVVYEGQTSVEELADEISIKVFPNPCSEFLNYQLPEDFGSVRYDLVNLLGKTMQTGRITADTGVINLSNELSKGIALLRFIRADGQAAAVRILID